MSTGGEVANALVCKTSIHGFNSHPVLHIFNNTKASRLTRARANYSCEAPIHLHTLVASNATYEVWSVNILPERSTVVLARNQYRSDQRLLANENLLITCRGDHQSLRDLQPLECHFEVQETSSIRGHPVRQFNERNGHPTTIAQALASHNMKRRKPFGLFEKTISPTVTYLTPISSFMGVDLKAK
jgi:hypothetical protein